MCFLSMFKARRRTKHSNKEAQLAADDWLTFGPDVNENDDCCVCLASVPVEMFVILSVCRHRACRSCFLCMVDHDLIDVCFYCRQTVVVEEKVVAEETKLNEASPLIVDVL
jgi:hypothetical protein